MSRIETITWWPERVDQLTAEWATGLSAEQVAVRLGHPRVSRNAVIGKVHRLGLPQRRTVGVARTGEKRSPRRSNRDVVGLLSNRAADRGKVNLPPTIVPVEDMAHRCTLLELTNATCRWPFGETYESAKLFCGSPTADLDERKPYCDFHSRFAYQEHCR